nr:dihydroxyacetone kinase subunit DhaK [Alicyclobacillus mali (ex Roth et al. 2021)]
MMNILHPNPDRLVTDMLDGFVRSHPGLARLPGTQVIVRSQLDQKVGLVSGGGSGHEPAHAGYVGYGMLDAAVAGQIFTSPTPNEVLNAIRAVDRGLGVLLIIKNYTGDVMNFEMAAELAQDEGIAVEKVIVADDVAVENSTFTIGRRGVAGTVFVHKIAGASAQRGDSLQEVKRIADKVAARVFSMGLALSPCILPTTGKPSFDLPAGEVEIGIGIHGEPGVRRGSIAPLTELVDMLIDRVAAESSLQKSDEVALMINGMGATPLAELGVCAHHAMARLDQIGVKIHKSLLGEYMTSLNMAGFSITVLKLDSELKSLLDETTHAPAWR